MYKSRLIHACALAIAATALCGTATAEEAPHHWFVIMADVPYNKFQEFNVNKHVNPAIDAFEAPFLVHLGDWKGQSDCTAEKDAAFAKWITDRKMPVFYTPGDNEWSDCDLVNGQITEGKQVSDLDRLKIIRDTFFAKPVAAPALKPARQAGQPENVSWSITKDGEAVVFGLVHTIGTRNGRADVFIGDKAKTVAAVDTRDKNNLAWIDAVFERAAKEKAVAVVIGTQADVTAGTGAQCIGDKDLDKCDPYRDLKDAVAAKAKAFKGPVMLMHGDTPPFCLEEGFHDTPNLWRFNTSGDHVLTDATVMSVFPGSKEPFQVRSLKWRTTPGRCE